MNKVWDFPQKFKDFENMHKFWEFLKFLEDFWKFWEFFKYLQKIWRFGKWHPKIQSGTYRQTCLWQKVDRKKLLKCQRGERLGGGHYKQENGDKHLITPTYWNKINLKIVSKIKIKQFRVQKENPTSKWGLTVPRPL